MCTGWYVNLERCDKLQIRWHRGVARSPRFGTASKGPCRPIAEGRHRGRADISRRSPPARKSYPADNIPTTPRPMMVAASDHQIGASPGATRPARVCTLGTNQNRRRGAASTATTATANPSVSEAFQRTGNATASPLPAVARPVRASACDPKPKVLKSIVVGSTLRAATFTPGR